MHKGMKVHLTLCCLIFHNIIYPGIVATWLQPATDYGTYIMIEQMLKLVGGSSWRHYVVLSRWGSSTISQRESVLPMFKYLLCGQGVSPPLGEVLYIWSGTRVPW